MRLLVSVLLAGVFAGTASAQSTAAVEAHRQVRLPR